MTIGVRLREERKRLGMTQAAFADEGGIGVSTLKLYEGDERDPGAGFLAAIAKLGADAQYIVTGQRSTTVLVAEEQVLLDGYRALDKGTKMRTLAFVLTETGPVYIQNQIKKKVAEQESQQEKPAAPGKKTIKGKNNSMVEGDNNAVGNK